MPQASANFSAIGEDERVYRTINFTAGLNSYANETLTGTPNITITTFSGVDLYPQTRLLASPTIYGNSVAIFIGTMLSGVTYQILCVTTTTLGQILELWTFQTCVGVNALIPDYPNPLTIGFGGTGATTILDAQTNLNLTASDIVTSISSLPSSQLNTLAEVLIQSLSIQTGSNAPVPTGSAYISSSGYVVIAQ